MKINNIGPSGINPYKNQAKQTIKASNHAKADQIEISNKALEMQERSKFTEARQEKVASLKIAVENGTYQVDPKTVAKNMINFYKK